MRNDLERLAREDREVRARNEERQMLRNVFDSGRTPSDWVIEKLVDYALTLQHEYRALRLDEPLYELACATRNDDVDAVVVMWLSSKGAM